MKPRDFGVLRLFYTQYHDADHHRFPYYYVVFRCAFGPTGSCGGTLAGKIIPKTNRILYTAFMFSGTMFGGFFGHLYSATAIPNVSHDGSYLALSVIGFAWVAVWATMMHLTPYDSDLDSIPVYVSFISTSWTTIIRSMPFVSLLNASFGYGSRRVFIFIWCYGDF